MRLRILGSAAGGGFPQWNCGCDNCRLARSGSPRTRPRTQDSVAVSSDGADWFLLNASPDIHRQLEAAPSLHPRAARESPLAGIVLTNGDLDHTLGLWSLRESQPLTVYATTQVRRGLFESNSIARTLDRFPGQLTVRPLTLDEETALGGLTVRAIPAPGKLPVHLAGAFRPMAEDNVALWIGGGGRSLLYAPGAAALTPALERALGEAEVVLFDGTFWSSDELTARGLGTSRAEDMAHLPIDGGGGDRGSLPHLASLRGRRFYTHINNSNPILVEDSPERRAVEAAGVEVAYDGLELEW